MLTSIKDNKQKVDLSTWKRKDHFHFFRSFAQPYWGVTTAINCTRAYQYCKSYRISFFMYSLYHSLRAANTVDAFRQRIIGKEVWDYNHIGGSITVLRNDDTFGFAYFDYMPEFNAFAESTSEAIRKVKITNGLSTMADVQNVIYFSVLKGISFTSMQHADSLYNSMSVPRIVFGQYTEQNGQLMLPLSVHVHHALCDGLHVERFLKLFSNKMELDS